jgi:predicted nucleic acid-binding protein
LSGFVLDASTALAWCFKDENSADADRAQQMLADSAALVSPIWHAQAAHGPDSSSLAGRVLEINLAMRERLPLATVDKALLQAAQAVGVTLI